MNKLIYKERFNKHHDELRWLYMELYDNSSMFAELCDNMMRFFSERKKTLKSMDCKREIQAGLHQTVQCELKELNTFGLFN